MKIRSSVYLKVFLALIIVGIVPMTISSILIIATYQDVTHEMISEFYHNDLDRFTDEHRNLARINNESTILVIITLCISLLITLFFTLFLTKAFTIPLIHVTKAVEMVGRGDFSIRIKTDRSDEFGRLADGFNNTTQALEDMRKKLIEGKSELERRVAERTAQLTLINNELRKTSEKIHESSRVKDEFLSNVSHELRTPLNAILGYSDLMLDGVYGQLSGQQIQSLDKIKKNSKMLLRLINDILDLSRMEEGHMPVLAEDFDVEELVGQTVEGVRALFLKKGLDIVVEYGDDLPRINNDRGKIQQILLNLLSNALKFTEKGRVVIVIKYNKNEGEVDFTVSDTGIGIDEKDIEVVFDQFRQLDGSMARKYGGTGLGLTISRKIATVIDGKLTVISEKGKGSSFKLSVPKTYGDFITRSRQLEKALVNKRIIVSIDDDADTLKLLADNLTPEGFRVIGCRDGDKGIRKTKELLPFAITLDIMMPYRDGWNVLRELKSSHKTKDIPVIIVSIIDDKPKGYKLGAKDYLVKPINREALLKAIQNTE